MTAPAAAPAAPAVSAPAPSASAPSVAAPTSSPAGVTQDAQEPDFMAMIANELDLPVDPEFEKDQPKPSDTEKAKAPPPAPTAEPKKDEALPPTKSDPKDAAIEALQKEVEALKKASKQTEAPAKPEGLAGFTDEELEQGITAWSSPDNEVPNAPVLIARAQKELARRAAQAENQRHSNAQQYQALKSQWDAQAMKDFPEVLTDGKLNQESPLFKAAMEAFQGLAGLQQRPDGGYLALVYAKGRLAMQKSPESKAPASAQPPPMIAAPVSAGPATTPSDTDTRKANTLQALDQYSKSKRMVHLEAAIKNRIGG